MVVIYWMIAFLISFLESRRRPHPGEYLVCRGRLLRWRRRPWDWA